MTESVGRLKALLDQIRSEFAPDPRLSVFEVDVEVDEGTLVLLGATSEPAAAEALHREAAGMGEWGPVRDEVVRLPDVDGTERAHAVVTAAVAPMLCEPHVNETQISQAVLGQHLLVLRRAGRWLQCRAPDGYLGWIHRGYLMLLDETDARAWEVGTEGEAWISLGAELLGPEGEVMARLPWGARVVRESADVVRLPDGRHGRPVGEMVSAALRATLYPTDGEAIARTAARWIGVPYLWGGVTQGGVDCSGFVQGLFRLHGVALPRDSDMQSRTGEPLEIAPDYSNLRAGDLLFFAEEPGKCSHVVLSAGGSRIIHSSLGNGGVARNDLLGELGYERELCRIYLCARRVLGAEGGVSAG